MTTLLETIKARAQSDPAFAALVAARDTQGMADALPLMLVGRDATTKFSSLGIAERFASLNGLPGPLAAEAALLKLEGFRDVALQSPDPVTKLLGSAVRRQMEHLSGAGMAIGSPAVAAMLAVIAQGGGLTQAEADALTAVADIYRKPTEFDVRRAVFADDGAYMPEVA